MRAAGGRGVGWGWECMRPAHQRVGMGVHETRPPTPRPPTAGRLVGGGRVGMGVHETRARVRAWTGRDRDVPPNSAQWAYTIVCGCVRESRCVSESVCIWGLGGVSGGALQ